MTRPIDETWRVYNGYAGRDNVALEGTRDIILESVGPCDGLSELAQARVRLAAAAPAMARLLVDLEWGADICIGYDNTTALGCPSCGGLQHDPGNRADFDHYTVGHDPDCALVAVLRAAGVVE